MPNKNGLRLIKPTSIASTGATNSSSINTNGSVTFTTCATLSLNGVFSSTYDNYIIMLRFIAASAGSNIYCRLRKNGVDDSSSSYTRQYVDVFSTTIAGQRLSQNEWNAVAYGGNTLRSGSVITLFAPFLDQPTAARTNTAYDNNNVLLTDSSLVQTTSISFDGLTLWPPGTTFTGLVSVYGMRK